MVSERRRALIRDAVDRRQSGFVLLDRVRNPHNVAAILRSCDAFGFGRVLMIQDSEHAFEPDTLGASVSRSANKWLDIERVEGSAAIDRVEALRASGFTFAITAVPDSEAAPGNRGAPPTEPLTESELLEPQLILGFGSERTGIDPRLAALADRRVTIPMLGLTESLNVAASAAIVLYEVHRQRTDAGLERYRLPAEERAALESSWLERSKERLNRRAAAARKRDRFTNGEW